MGLEAVSELECETLGALLREPREAELTLLLDCRPFLAFCRRHVRAARPVPWNAMLRRRARGPPAAVLACLVPDRALRARLARGELARAVVLDQAGTSLAALPPDGPARVLLAALLQETRAGPAAVCFLRGEHPAFPRNVPVPSSPSPPINRVCPSPQEVSRPSRPAVPTCALSPLPRRCRLLVLKTAAQTPGLPSMTRCVEIRAPVTVLCVPGMGGS